MKVVNQSFKILTNLDRYVDEMLGIIEYAGRTCYQSEMGNRDEFIRRRIETHHESVLEHGLISVEFTTDRGVTHELVRHRIASFSQESTRYCNYGKDKFDGGNVKFIQPVWFETDFTLRTPKELEYIALNGSTAVPFAEIIWLEAMLNSEMSYLALLGNGYSPQYARTVLNNSLKTSIIVSMNPREWRWFFSQRTSEAAHPQMRALAIGTLHEFQAHIPVLFDDIKV